MKIRKTEPDDLERIMEIYAGARRFMAEHGNPDQWGATNWPPENLIRSDIAGGNSYVCVNDANRIIGTFFFIQGRDVEPNYREITDGGWIDGSPYGVVHRIASDGSEKGTGAFCIGWAYEQCGHLRIDTHGKNKVMQNLLAGLGFVHCGTIYVEEDNDPRLAYEKSSLTERRLSGRKSYAFYGWETADIRDGNGLTPRDYYDMLSGLWSADTCAPRMRADWTPENRTLGQCSITAFLMQDIYGGKVLGVPLGDGYYHCFNEAGGCVFDLTSEQFGDRGLDYSSCPEQSREVHFARAEKKERYEKLRKQLYERLKT